MSEYFITVALKLQSLNDYGLKNPPHFTTVPNAQLTPYPNCSSVLWDALEECYLEKQINNLLSGPLTHYYQDCAGISDSGILN